MNSMIDLYELSPRSLLTAIARMVEEEGDEAIINTPSVEQAGGSDDGLSGIDWAAVVYPRVAGVITIISSTAMVIVAWERRKFLFHRLVLGMAIHQFTYGVTYVIGAMAIPREESSYAGVMCGFDKHKYQWCEKWIHGIAIGIPVIMAIYYLPKQGYNPSYGFCAQTSYPLGCAESEEVECERGPKEKGTLSILLPMSALVVVPTTIMAVLYYKVKMLESSEEVRKACILESRTIAIQSFVYLSALYWTIIPYFIWVGLDDYSEIDPDKLSPYALAARVNHSLFSLWTMLIYRHFSIDRCKKRCGKPKAKSAKTITATRKGSVTEHASPVFDPNEKPESSTRRTDACDFIFNTGEHSSCNVAETSSTESPTIRTDKPEEDDRVPAESPQSKPRYSFNIFDGTNASVAYTEFIHGADSDDERMDQAETDRWASIQSHM